MKPDLLTGRILIIDDDEQILLVLKRFLSKNYKIDSFNNGEDALLNYTKNRYDLAITDIGLPGIDGIDVLKMIREIEPDLPVIVETGLGEMDIAISALKNGAFDFIQKPYNISQIEIAVKKAVDRTMLVRENKYLVTRLKDKNKKLKELNKEIQYRNNQIERDLNIANNLQACLYPTSLPELQGFNVYAKTKSVEKISGDFYLFDILQSDRLLFIIGDVSGHGVPAALYSAIVKSAITSIDKDHLTPSEALKKINLFLINAQKRNSYNYLTICYMILDKAKSEIIYSNAGIPAPVLVRASDGIESMKQNGPFVGIFEEAEYVNNTLPLIFGDKIIIFTDGAYESYCSNDVLNAYNTIKDLILNNIKRTIPDIINVLFDALMAEKEKVVDDASFIGIEFIGKV